MAKQTPNWGNGTRPDGSDGDTFLEGTQKLMDNINEIYAMMGEDSNGVLPAALPVEKGGTGAGTAASARTNLGLNEYLLKDATNYSYADSLQVMGNASQVAKLRIGSYTVSGTPHIDFLTGGNATDRDARIVCSGGAVDVNEAAVLTYRAAQHTFNGAVYTPTSYSNTTTATSGRLTLIASDGRNYARGFAVDANGFFKSASPVVNMYADRIELNDDAAKQPITFEKLGIGDYLLKGSLGFAQEGWYIDQPNDANGNKYHALTYGTYENGDIWVKTYEQVMDGVKIVADVTKPVDIQAGRYVQLRLHEEPEPIVIPEPEPEPILDDTGNPAPSRYHELVDGVWTISEENAAILNMEQLAAMPSLKRRQFRLALVLNGFNLADIEAMIATIPDDLQRQIVTIEWQDATDFERTNPSLLFMADMLGLSQEQVNNLWVFGLNQ